MRVVLAILLGMGGAGALARFASSDPTARLGAAVVVALLACVITGVVRARAWALGAAFFCGLFTLWAVVALGLRHQIGALGTAFGIAWAAAVMATSVLARPDARQGLHETR